MTTETKSLAALAARRAEAEGAANAYTSDFFVAHGAFESGIRFGAFEGLGDDALALARDYLAASRRMVELQSTLLRTLRDEAEDLRLALTAERERAQRVEVEAQIAALRREPKRKAPADRAGEVLEAKRQIEAETGRKATQRQIADQLGLSQSRVQVILQEAGQ